MEKKKTKTSQHSSAKEEQDSRSILWKRRGIDDVYFQRETVVTFMSILGGVAVGALLTQFIPMVEQVRDSRWHLILYFAASISIMLNSWVQTAWATLIVKSQISFSNLIPQFLYTFFTSVMCLLLTIPSGWFAAVGTLMAFSMLGSFVAMKSDLWDSYSPQRVKEIKRGLLFYCIIMVLVFGASVHLNFYPTKTNEFIWGIFAVFSSIAALVLQHKGMEHERRELGIP